MVDTYVLLDSQLANLSDRLYIVQKVVGVGDVGEGQSDSRASILPAGIVHRHLPNSLQTDQSQAREGKEGREEGIEG